MIFYRAMPIEADGIRSGDYLTPTLRFAREHALTTSVYHGEDYGVFVVLVGKDEYREASNPGEYIYTGEGKPARLVGIAKYNDEYADSEYQRVKLGSKETLLSDLGLTSQKIFRSNKNKLRKGATGVELMVANNIWASMLKELTKLANDLDSKGLTKEADALDDIIKEASNKDCMGPQGILEQDGGIYCVVYASASTVNATERLASNKAKIVVQHAVKLGHLKEDALKSVMLGRMAISCTGDTSMGFKVRISDDLKGDKYSGNLEVNFKHPTKSFTILDAKSDSTNDSGGKEKRPIIASLIKKLFEAKRENYKPIMQELIAELKKIPGINKDKAYKVFDLFTANIPLEKVLSSASEILGIEY